MKLVGRADQQKMRNVCTLRLNGKPHGLKRQAKRRQKGHMTQEAEWNRSDAKQHKGREGKKQTWGREALQQFSIKLELGRGRWRKWQKANSNRLQVMMNSTTFQECS